MTSDVQHHHAYGEGACPHPTCVANTTPKDSEKFYKIRRISDGLYVAAGYGFNKKGRIWRNINSLRNHLNWVQPTHYAGCEIVQFETTQIAIVPMSEEFAAQAERKLKAAIKKQKIKEAWEEIYRADDIAKLKELKAKYPDV